MTLDKYKQEDPEKHDKLVDYLLEFYVKKNYAKVEPMGFLSGIKGTTTYGIQGFNRDVWPLVEFCRENRIAVRFMKNEQDRRKLDALFDATEEELEQIRHENPIVDEAEAIKGLMPEWAKDVLVKYNDMQSNGHGKNDRRSFGFNNDRRDRDYNRPRDDGFRRGGSSSRRDHYSDNFYRDGPPREKQFAKGGFMTKKWER